jgi:hypothetical protein
VNYSRSLVKVMMIALETVVGEEKSYHVCGEALDNTINNFHHTLDAGLKKMTSHINSTKMTSRIQHKTVMQELSVLVTKRDIQKAMNAMLPAKRHKTGRGGTSSIHPRTLCAQGLLTDIRDMAEPPSDHDEDTSGDDTAQDESLVQEDSMEYILGDNGLTIGWLTYKPSFMETKYGGNVSDLWKAWHKEGVDVITKYREHSKKWCVTWTAAEVKQYNRLCFIIDHIVEQVGGNMDLVSAMLKQMGGEKGEEKLSTVYTRIKNIIKVESTLKH